MKKGKDTEPVPDPYLWLKDSDPGPGETKNIRIRLQIPSTDIKSINGVTDDQVPRV